MNYKEYLINFFYFLGVDEEQIHIDVVESSDAIRVSASVEAPQAEKLIKNGGQNLTSLQSLMRLTFKEKLEGKRLILDINGFVKQKEELLVSRAMELAEQVLETGQPKTFYDLNSFERYLVHSSVAGAENLRGVSTYSTTVEGKRYLTICLDEDMPGNKIDE
ncbi:MAG: DNA/RNA-binding protein [Microgenomates bacterium 39_7]|nr:MAG: DNA/RNA-binding protein [Microgenomates bacterium 39_7]